MIYISNVFKKLIHKELGEANYYKYFSYVKKSVENKTPNSQIIFNDMYDKLKYRDRKSIAKMHYRLNDTMLLAFRISRNFIFAFAFYLATSIIIISRDIQPPLALGALILINICFVYKTYEFITNKFCYIDAQIVLVYKAVLDRLLMNETQSNQKNNS